MLVSPATLVVFPKDYKRSSCSLLIAPQSHRAAVPDTAPSRPLPLAAAECLMRQRQTGSCHMASMLPTVPVSCARTRSSRAAPARSRALVEGRVTVNPPPPHSGCREGAVAPPGVRRTAAVVSTASDDCRRRRCRRPARRRTWARRLLLHHSPAPDVSEPWIRGPP